MTPIRLVPSSTPINPAQGTEARMDVAGGTYMAQPLVISTLFEIRLPWRSYSRQLKYE